MVMMAGRVSAEYDGDTSKHLTGGISVTQAGADRDVNTAVAIDTLLSSGMAYWDNDEVPQGWVAVNLHITASAQNSGVDTFDFKLEAYTSSVFSSLRTEIGSLFFTGAPAAGFYRFAVDAKTAAILLDAQTHWALSCTKSHASCSVTYSAWLSALKAS